HAEADRERNRPERHVQKGNRSWAAQPGDTDVRRNRYQGIPIGDRDAAENEDDGEHAVIVVRQLANEQEIQDEMESALQRLAAERQRILSSERGDLVEDPLERLPAREPLVGKRRHHWPIRAKYGAERASARCASRARTTA